MMEPLDSPDRGNDSAPPLSPPPPPLAPTSPLSLITSTDAEATVESSATDRDMVFFRRPDLNARHLFFQRGDSSAQSRVHSSVTGDNGVPVQLVGVDGRTQIGMPVSTSTRQSSEVSVAPHEGRRGPRDGRLSRLVVTSEALSDASTKQRLRHIKILFFGAAVANIALTVSLLFPSDSDAWFYVDGFDSTVGPSHLQRVKTNRPALLVMALACSSFGSVAVARQNESLLTIYILGTVVSDLWTLTLLLPHVFFLLRLLFDALLVLLAVEARSYLSQQWFVTNFHRLRY